MTTKTKKKPTAKKPENKTLPLYKIAKMALGNAVAFKHEVVGLGEWDYLITRGFLMIESDEDGTQWVVIDGEYDIGGRLYIPANTQTKLNEAGTTVEFKFDDHRHRLTFYGNKPINLAD